MARLACVNLPALPLQLLLRRHPDWQGQPAAVVSEDTAQGRLLWVNHAAQSGGVRTGMRYAQALSLQRGLRAGTLAPAEIAATVRALVRRLRTFSPYVEPAEGEPGVFRLDGRGLGRLYPSASAWARGLHGSLSSAGYQAVVVVGFDRFATYALAKAQQGQQTQQARQGGLRKTTIAQTTIVQTTPAQERQAARAVPLEVLGLPPRVRDALLQLGLSTVGDLLRLPAAGLQVRFGPELYRLHQQAAGLLAEVLEPVRETGPVRQTLLLDWPEADAVRLLFLLKPHVQALLDALAARGRTLAALHLRLTLDASQGESRQSESPQGAGHPAEELRITPAAPTLDGTLLTDLLRLHLERLVLRRGVVEVVLHALPGQSPPQQLSLFEQQPRRDLAAGARALARLRAELGDDAVGRLVPRQGHLPEARFGWEPVLSLQAAVTAGPSAVAVPVEAAPTRADLAPTQGLVRRLYPRPQPLPGWRREPGRRVPGRESETDSLRALHGPYTVAGGWWAKELQRDYYFAETPHGEVLWVYHDRRRNRWFAQGRVE